jgi:hypothetical protein
MDRHDSGWNPILSYLRNVGDRGRVDETKALEFKKPPVLPRLPWWAVEEIVLKLCRPQNDSEKRKAICLVSLPAGWSLSATAKKLGVSRSYVVGVRYRARLWDPEVFDYLQQKVRQLLIEATEAGLLSVKDSLQEQALIEGSD